MIIDLLSKLLKNPKSKDKVKDCLEKIGFDDKISTIIDLSKEFPNSLHEKFLSLLLYYV